MFERIRNYFFGKHAENRLVYAGESGNYGYMDVVDSDGKVVGRNRVRTEACIRRAMNDGWWPSQK